MKYYISRAGELSLKYDFNPKSIKLSNAKKRLGVCNQCNDIRINWRLIVAPKDVIDYVLVHELVHIKIKNHSKICKKNADSEIPNIQFSTYQRDLTLLSNTIYDKKFSENIIVYITPSLNFNGTINNKLL